MNFPHTKSSSLKSFNAHTYLLSSEESGEDLQLKLTHPHSFHQATPVSNGGNAYPFCIHHDH